MVSVSHFLSFPIGFILVAIDSHKKFRKDIVIAPLKV